VQGQACDGADTAAGLPDDNHLDNANMSTPPDGTPPTMQMYLFEDPYVASHSADDPSIIFHEYTHGLSNRLVVDADGVSTLGSIQAGSMGEAWSDWYAMSYLVDQGLEKDTKTIGDVQEAQYTAAGEEFRSESLDCTVGAVSDFCAGTPAAGPGGYTYGDFGKIAAGPEVHADGEIWSQTLWDLRNAIGAKQSQSLVTRAMELSPANPSFLDERNSILQADQAVNGGKLQKTIWKVFAHRGMGYFAGAVSGDDASPVEDFSLPPAADTPRGSLTGVVADKDTAAPVSGATVQFGGHASGFAGDYAATTGTDGKYTISGILPGTYPKVSASGAGYDPAVQTVSVGARVNTLNWALRRDWAASSGGGSIVDFDLPDYTSFGCGPINLIDQSQGSGWGSDAVQTGGPGTTAVQPKHATIKLPTAVNVSELTINPSNTCGDSGSASTGDFKVETSTNGTTWVLGAQGHFTPAQRTVNSVPLAAGSGTGIQYVRYTMLSTQVADLGGTCPGAYSGCDFMGSTEVGVYGVPAS